MATTIAYVSGGFAILSGIPTSVLSGITARGVKGGHRICGVDKFTDTDEYLVLYSL